jgi:hypothetical protein
VVIWYIFPRFGILDQEKSGNPGSLHLKKDWPETCLPEKNPDLKILT